MIIVFFIVLVFPSFDTNVGGSTLVGRIYVCIIGFIGLVNVYIVVIFVVVVVHLVPVLAVGVMFQNIVNTERFR